MFKFILKRIAEAIPVLLLVSTVTFFFMRLAPGGPFDSDKQAPQEVIEMLNERYNLNAPLYEQYFDYLANLVRFDFGPSFKYPGRTVNEIIASGLPVSFELGIYAIIFALLLGISAGVIAALKKNSWLDYLPMSTAMIGVCVPSILLGPMLQLVLGMLLPEFLFNKFGIDFRPFEVSGWEGGLFQNMSYKILPAVTLGSGAAAYIARLTRGSMLEIFSQDYIRTARAKGLSEWTVIWKHSLRGGLFPVISYLGPAMAGLLAGSFVTESIFQINGIGRNYVRAAFDRDYTMIMGTTMLFAVLLYVFNLIVDVILVALNPRLKFEN